MRIISIIFLLLLPFVLFAQDNVTGRYRDYFGNRIVLNPDNTFKYTWHFDMQSSWTKGTWSLKDDTVYFQMTPIYDTVTFIYFSNKGVDSLILSTDETSERFTQQRFAVELLTSGGQNRMNYPERLVFKKGRLYKVQNGN
jgi:hypothetical protein